MMKVYPYHGDGGLGSSLVQAKTTLILDLAVCRRVGTACPLDDGENPSASRRKPEREEPAQAWTGPSARRIRGYDGLQRGMESVDQQIVGLLRGDGRANAYGRPEEMRGRLSA